MSHVIFAIIGLISGGLINLLADYLPARRLPELSPSFLPHPISHTLALPRYFSGEFRPKSRAVLTEFGTALVFAILPAFSHNPAILFIHALYIAILILVIVIDVEHRLILHVVTFPTTLAAILLSLIVQDDAYYSWKSAIAGAIIGFAIFYFFYWVGRLLFGEGALGFGDVTLSMTMGAMLGFHRIVLALVLAIVLGGVISLLLLVVRIRKARSYLPYGPYLASAGIIMLLWGTQIYEWYVN